MNSKPTEEKGSGCTPLFPAAPPLFPAAGCPSCHGRGTLEIGALPDWVVTCTMCEGTPAPEQREGAAGNVKGRATTGAEKNL